MERQDSGLKTGNTANLSIREAVETDAEAIAFLTSQLGYEANPESTLLRLRSVLGNASDLVLVAEAGTQGICGWLQAHASTVVESGFRVEIVGLIVAEFMRRSGVGRLLVGRAEAWARRQGSSVFVVRSNITRKESHVFYPALGFKAAKSQTVYRKTLSA